MMQESPTEAPGPVVDIPRPLNERFETLQLLPEGSFGPSWHMKDRSSNAHVVLRCLSAGKSAPTFRSDIRRIAETIGHCQNAVPVSEILDVDEHVWLMRDWVYGENLDDALRALKILTHEQARLLIGAVCRGLMGNEDEQLIHGNLSPDNILIDSGGRVAVSDHGLRCVGAEPGKRRMLQFLAPEVVAGEPPSVRSDVYSLGALLYLALCGMYPLPFGSNDVANERILAAHNIVPPPKGVRLAGGIGHVVWRSFQARPQDRFASVDMFLDALGRTRGRESSTFFGRLQSRLLDS